MRELYSHTPAASFGPLALKAVRRRVIDRDWCRSLVKRHERDKTGSLFDFVNAPHLSVPLRPPGGPEAQLR